MTVLDDVRSIMSRYETLEIGGIRDAQLQTEDLELHATGPGYEDESESGEPASPRRSTACQDDRCLDDQRHIGLSQC